MVESDSSLVKLVDNLEREGWLEVNLSDEDKKLIGPTLINGVAIPGFYRTANLGYIDPSSVVRYRDTKANKIFLGSPELAVYINFADDPLVPGGYHFFRGKGEESHVILSGHISESDIVNRKINPKYVVEDNRGVFVPITKERIEREIQKEIDKVNSGYRGDFLKSEKLAKVAGFDFSKKIREAEDYDLKEYVKRYSEEENLQEVLRRLESWGDYGFGLSMNIDERGGYAEEIFDEFCDVLPKIKFPNDELRKRAGSLLAQYEKEASVIAKSRREKLEREMREEIGFLQQERDRAKSLLNFLRNN